MMEGICREALGMIRKADCREDKCLVGMDYGDGDRLLNVVAVFTATNLMRLVLIVVRYVDESVRYAGTKMEGNTD